jgi:hypothetical protein
MSTKTIVILVVCIVLVIGALIAGLGAIVGVVFYSIGQSEAARAAKEFLRSNEVLKQDIGEVRDFGTFVTGNISVKDNSGNATINLKVIGERKNVNASVELTYANGNPWRVVGASYQNEDGKTINLLTPQDAFIIPLKRAA